MLPNRYFSYNLHHRASDIRCNGNSLSAGVPIGFRLLLRKGTKMIRIRHVLLASFLALVNAVSGLAQESIPWITDLSQARRIAEQQQRLVLLHFWGDGCQPCQQLEANVFNQPELIRVVSSNFVPVKVHVQQQPSIANYYKITQIPTDIIVFPSGVQVFRTSSPANVNAYIAMLDQVRANALANGFREVDRVARNVAEQLAPIIPTLPPRNPEETPTSQPVNGDWTVRESQPSAPQQSLRNAPPGPAYSPEQSRSSMVNNEFVGPLDHKTQPSRAATGPRYGNPYLNDTPAQAPAGQSPTGSPGSVPPLDTTADSAASNVPATSVPATSVPATNVPASKVPPTYVPSSNVLTSNPPEWSRESVTGTALPANPAVPSVPANPSWTPPQLQPTSPSAGPQPAAEAAPGGALQLPPGVPPLALDGHCPVTLMMVGKWEKGDARFGVVHRERTYLFKSQIERDRFLAPAAADRFAPVLSGLDSVRFAETGQAVNGRREHGVLFDGQIFLFADEESLVRFEQQPHRYVSVVRQAMTNLRSAPPQR